MNQLITHLITQYGLEGEARNIQSFGAGHIHRTFKLDAGTSSYILQQFNRTVFPFPDRITANLDLLHAQLDMQKLPFQLPLPITNLNGQSLMSFKGEWYRLFPFVSGKSINQVQHLGQAQLAAKAFGSFIHACQKIDTAPFKEVIPGFHDLSMRFEQFQNSLRETELVFPELKELVQAYLNQAPLVAQYQQYQKVLPLRITHNDTKINNLIFDHDFSKVNALIDLDTVMPGYVFYDFGDLVRTAACG